MAASDAGRPAGGAEAQRLEADERREANWSRWGPYLAERQWGTVREDYSSGGTPWDYFPHDHARSRAYRWGEDGLLGITDRECRLCFALALWNGKDPILKERLFGLTGPEGNHGEDVKELYYYLDATPTPSYLKALYKYPQGPFPYARLVEENRTPRPRRSGVRAGGYRDLRRGQVLRRRRRVREGRPRRHPRARHLRQPRPRSGRPPPAPQPLAAKHLVVGALWRGLLAERPNHPRDGEIAGGGTPFARALAPRLRAAGRPGPAADLHRERDQRGASVRSPERRPLGEGRVSSPRRGRRSGRREPGRRREQGGRLVPAHDPGGGRGGGAVAADRRGRRHGGAVRPGVRAAPRRAARRGRRLPRLATGLSARSRGAQDRAPGRRRVALVAEVLRLRRRAVAGGRSGPAASAALAPGRAEPRLGAPVRARRPLDARTPGSTRGSRRGTSPSSAWRWRESIRPSRSTSCCCSAASGSCTRARRSPRTSSPSGTSTRRCTRGPRGASISSARSAASGRTGGSWRRSSRSAW